MLGATVAALRGRALHTIGSLAANATELATEVVELQNEMLNLEAINAQLTHDVAEMHSQLTVLEASFHAHGRWEWAGLYELEGTEHDWTFTDEDASDMSVDVAVLPTSDAASTAALEALRSRAELLLASPCQAVYGSTRRPAPRLRPAHDGGTCFRLFLDQTQVATTTFVMEPPSSGRYAVFAQHAPAEYRATRLIRYADRHIIEPVANLTCCDGDVSHEAQPQAAAAAAAATAQASSSDGSGQWSMGSAAAMACSVAALLLSAAALCAARGPCVGAARRAAGGGRYQQRPGGPAEVVLPSVMSVAVDDEEKGGGRSTHLGV